MLRHNESYMIVYKDSWLILNIRICRNTQYTSACIYTLQYTRTCIYTLYTYMYIHVFTVFKGMNTLSITKLIRTSVVLS